MHSQKLTRESCGRDRWYDDACGTALALEFVGERWSLLIMRELLLGPRRFGEIRAALPGLSANILTQRLAGLEQSGIVVRRAGGGKVQLYALTAWGLECEPIIMAMGRWALRSPAHDPTLAFSPSALVLSLRMLVQADRADDWAARIGIVADGERFVCRLENGELHVARGEVAGTQAQLTGRSSAFLPVVYGAMPIIAAERSGLLIVEGDRTVAERFVTLFSLPSKVGG